MVELQTENVLLSKDSIPFISIIVPCYNVEDFLSETIESIINQTYTNWELILVDDGSVDNTPKICDEYALKDSRIVVLHKSNGGLVSARNAGYEIVSGEWHMYLDGDDWIDKDTFSKLVKQIKKYPEVDMLFWKCAQELGNKTIKDKWEWECFDNEHLYTKNECKELARHTLIYKSGIATASCKLLRTEYTEKKNIRHDDRLRQGAEGIEFSLRAFYYSNNVLFVNEYFTHYRYNVNSISKKVNEKNTLYIIECFNLIEDKIAKLENKEHLYAALYQRIVYVIIAIAMSTYFHPANEDGILIRIKKYTEIIENTPLFKKSIRNASTEGMDRMRIITLFFIRMKLYFMLQIISTFKQYCLKIGKFNY